MEKIIMEEHVTDYGPWLSENHLRVGRKSQVTQNQLLKVLLFEQEKQNAQYFQEKVDPDIDQNQLSERTTPAESSPKFIESIHNQ
jgi:hypothetical protein